MMFWLPRVRYVTPVISTSSSNLERNREIYDFLVNTLPLNSFSRLLIWESNRSQKKTELLCLVSYELKINL